MASAKRDPQSGSGGFVLSKVQGQSSGLVGGSGAKPPEADDMFALLDYICELILTLVTQFC